MKKVVLFTVLFTLMTLSAKAQWFDFSENNDRAVVGLNTGLVGYRNVSDLGSADTWAGSCSNPWADASQRCAPPRC